MNGMPSLLSNDLQRGFNAGLSSLVPPQRRAAGGANDADSEPYEYVYDPEKMTYTLVEKKKPVEETKKTEVQGDASPGFAPPQGKPSGKGFVQDITDAAKGLVGLIGKGGVIGAIGRGLAGLIGGQPQAPAAVSEMGSIGNVSMGSLGGTGIEGISSSGEGVTGAGSGVSLGGVDTGIGPDGQGLFAHGGVAHAAKGMSMEDNSFIIPADVTAAMGNGSSQAGLRALQQYISPDIQMIRGNGDGMSDSIPANIAGTQPALISDGEAYVPPGVVQAMGGGNMSKGASNLYAMMDEARSQAHGDTKQQRQVNPQKIISKVARA